MCCDVGVSEPIHCMLNRTCFSCVVSTFVHMIVACTLLCFILVTLVDRVSCAEKLDQLDPNVSHCHADTDLQVTFIDSQQCEFLLCQKLAGPSNTTNIIVPFI